VLSIYTTERGVRFSWGNVLDDTLVGTSGRMYREGVGFALEAQHSTDTRTADIGTVVGLSTISRLLATR
jgi:hypothetical protein